MGWISQREPAITGQCPGYVHLHASRNDVKKSCH